MNHIHLPQNLNFLPFQNGCFSFLFLEKGPLISKVCDQIWMRDTSSNPHTTGLDIRLIFPVNCPNSKLVNRYQLSWKWTAFIVHVGTKNTLHNVNGRSTNWVNVTTRPIDFLQEGVGDVTGSWSCSPGNVLMRTCNTCIAMLINKRLKSDASIRNKGGVLTCSVIHLFRSH